MLCFSSLLCSKSRKCSLLRNHRGKCDKKRLFRDFWNERKCVIVQNCVREEKSALSEAADLIQTERAGLDTDQNELQVKRQRIQSDMRQAKLILEDTTYKSGKIVQI